MLKQEKPGLIRSSEMTVTGDKRAKNGNKGGYGGLPVGIF